MRIAVIYSSRTGNTRKVAEAIHESLPEGAELCRIDDAPDPSRFDLIFVGFWVDKGTANKDAQTFMQKLSGQRVALFGTLGAYPDSDHARQCLERASALLPTCTVVDTFICQGAIDPKLIEWMKTLHPDNPHGPNEARRKLWHDAESHPDETDLASARQWAARVIAPARA